MKEKQRGITLIALVITIVVLMILAAISINLVLGDDGIISRAERAEEHQANAEAHDQEKMDSLSNVTNDKIDGGKIEELEKVDVPENWDSEKVDAVKSEDGEIIPIPKGYAASTVEGEKSVNTGLVIKEGTNEFVWVPVRNISDIHDETNNIAQLWKFYGTSCIEIERPVEQNKGFREPDVITKAEMGNDSSSGSDFDALSSNLQQAGLSSTATVADFKVQLQNEFNNMIESVKKYGGFYIGRYETGDLSKDKATVQKGNADIADQSWYTQYRLNKTVGANNNVITSMIWGCQWDATLKWMQNEGTTDIVKNYPTSSRSYGNYYDNSISYVDIDGITKTTTSGTDTRIPTGSAEITKMNNIYDMAGNVWDWTMECGNINTRTLRGGVYISNGLSYPAGHRINYGSTNNNVAHGSRATLYITI